MTASKVTARSPKLNLLLRIADGLSYAATPAFVLMAVLAASGTADMCGSVQSMSPLNDMAIMYLLMSVFHLPTWLRLAARRGSSHLRV
ncbi:hypothetical protein [Phyllobacterium sp. UNC302MFCol5.2]|uniref:hypothetical protein n=1 Tax=Phyllobacterium sp. UNC302MFCol5.2 TaxID=1449065 RepID=UPI0004883DFF|nr:hypothetical protein [Phyllobacterium sp. UNC302MFCol5.2]